MQLSAAILGQHSFRANCLFLCNILIPTYCCCNKLSKLQCWKKKLQKCITSQFWRSEFLKWRYGWGCVPSGGSRECVSLLFLASRAHLEFLACGPFLCLQSQHQSNFKFLILSFLPASSKDPCNYIGVPGWSMIISSSMIIIRSLTEAHMWSAPFLKCLFLRESMHVRMFVWVREAQREKGTEDLKQALCWQQTARCSAWTHHEIMTWAKVRSPTDWAIQWDINWLSHPVGH